MGNYSGDLTELYKKYVDMKLYENAKELSLKDYAVFTNKDANNAKFVIPQINEYYLGQFMYFLMLSVAYEGEIANVDAYNQPGVEIYKKFMKEEL